MNSINSFTRKDVELINVKTVCKSYYRIDQYQLKHRLFKGGWSPDIYRDVYERGSAIVCLPYDPVLDRVILIEQFRTGAYAEGAEDCWLVEAVAGIIEVGEKLEDVVHREAAEEAGCALHDLKYVGDYYATPGGCSEKLTVYIGHTDSEGIGGIHGVDEEDEDIRVFSTSFDEAMDLLDKGKISNIALVVALQWLALNKQDLRKSWLGIK